MNNLASQIDTTPNGAAAQLAARTSQLFSLPDIYLRLLELVNDEHASIDQISDLIMLDAGLAARLLRMANSSFYNFPSQVDTVTRAITLIGSKELCNLVLATSVANSFNSIPETMIDMDSFWRHNVDTGLVARHLGKLAGIREVERFFTVGLLHNIGKLLVVVEEPEAAKRSIAASRTMPPWVAEREILGFTFAEVGAELMKIWGLPEALVDAVSYQHVPQDAEQDVLTAAILNIASRAASAMDQETSESEGLDYFSLIEPAAWACCGLEEADLQPAIEYANVEAWNIMGMITSSLY